MNNELLTVLSYLEREKGISRDVLVKAIENALQSAAKKSLGTSRDVRVSIDPRTCEISTFQSLIVSDTEKGTDFVTVDMARRVRPDAQPGDVIEVKAAPRDFGRIAAQTAKQALMQNIRNAEREVVYQRYLPHVGTIVSATVKQVVRGSCICEIEGGGEAILDSKNKLPSDKFHATEQFRAMLLRVENEKDQNTPGIVLSRTGVDFVKALFMEQVTEMKEGVVEIMGVARDPGYRTKMAVRSLNPKVDPVGACVGMRGGRIKPVITELNGEKIDIIEWNEDIRVFAMNSLAPAKIESIRAERDEDGSNMIVATVLPGNYTQAIGKHGQNVRLTASLLGWKIKVEKAEEPKSFEELVREAIQELSTVLDIPADQAETVFNLGFHSPEGITNVSAAEFIQATQLDEEDGERIWNAAAAFLASKGEHDE
ncbi:MAG: transcription termination factor NusA [Kiritimatiellia bacterium]|jgi:N utilization substance protein A